MKETHFEEYKLSLVDSINKNYNEVLVTYPYKNKSKHHFLFISKKKGANDEYYLEEAKNILKKGEIKKYTRRPRKPFKRFVPLIVVGATVITLGAAAVGGYFIYKVLTMPPILDIVYQDSSSGTKEIIEYLKTKPYKYNTSEEGFPNYLATARTRIKEDERDWPLPDPDPDPEPWDTGNGYLQTTLEEEKAKLVTERREDVANAITEYPFNYIVGVEDHQKQYNFKTYCFEPISDYSRVIFYLHGGAYFKNISEKHLASCYDLANKLNAKVYMPLYPIGPLYDANDCFQYVNTIYQEIAQKEHGKEMIISGDSAGGGLAISYTQYLYNYNKNRPHDDEHPEIPMPSARILFSPWCDLSMTNFEIPFLEDKDVFLSSYGLREIGKIWAGSYDVTDYKISPKYGEFEDKIPSIIFHGSDELLFPDSRDTAIKMALGGARTRLVVGKGLFHIYPLFRTYPLVLPESNEAFDMIYDFIVNKK